MAFNQEMRLHEILNRVPIQTKMREDLVYDNLSECLVPWSAILIDFVLNYSFEFNLFELRMADFTEVREVKSDARSAIN